MPKPGFIHDIVLIKLSKPLVYTDVVQPLPIGPADEDYPHIGKAVVSGWGYPKARPHGPVSDYLFSSKLKSSTIEIFTKEECIQIYSNAPPVVRNISGCPSMMCAGVLEGHKDSCHGDSGGPLQCLDSAGQKLLCGVIATGYGCGVPGQPGFYTIVSTHVSWIKHHAGEPDQPTIPY